MRKTQRIATLGVAVIATGALFGGTAGAQANGTASGSATAEALTIRLFGTEITTSAATAEVGAGKAQATAKQVLTPAFTSPEYSAVADAPGEADRDPDTDAPCDLADLAQLPGIVRSDATCGFAEASVTENGGSAKAQGAELVLEPSVNELLATLQLDAPVQDGVGTIFEALNPIVEGLTGTPIGDAVETVEQVLTDTLSLSTTARVVVAPAKASVETDGCDAVASAAAQGVRIELLPVAAEAELLPDDIAVNEPLITITVGSASVSESVNCDGSQGAPEHKAGAVTIAFGTSALFETLGLQGTEQVVIDAGQQVCVLEGTPLETCVAVANAGVDAEGHPFADSTTIHALKGVNGGIEVATGRAAANNAQQPAQTPLPTPEPVKELARTGGPAVLPFVGGGLLALAAGARRLGRRR